MGLLPDTHAARIAFFQNRITTWTTEATNIGTTAGAVTALATAATAAADALAAQESAQSAAKTATLNLRLALDNMTNLGMAIVEQVRTKARSAGDGVYVLADIPAPAIPSPKGPPGEPYQLKVTLQTTGAIELTWKCDNPAGASGTIYQIFRKVGDEATFTYQGGTGQKKFIDMTLPTPVSSVTYQIQGVRSTAVGPWGTFLVTFGTTPSGTMTASVTDVQPSKIAA